MEKFYSEWKGMRVGKFRFFFFLFVSQWMKVNCKVNVPFQDDVETTMLRSQWMTNFTE